MKISLCGEQSVSSDEENISDSSSMAYGQIQVLSNHILLLLASLA
jgi:hypothetical protein